ncbi:MAG TPA: hypothetical protein VJM33_02595 [Microthrixaceae bacterium]|nr:hypothetical protein [Microthrixaceae bacterium]
MPDAPSDDPTDDPMLTELRRLADAGYDAQFKAGDRGQVDCLTCRRSFPASALDADRLIRLEGASDPADMVAIVPAECPHCSARGPLVLSYGPSSEIEDVDVLSGLEREPAPRPAPHD